VRDNAGESDTEHTTFTHGYDANGNLDTLSDSSPGAGVDRYELDYNGINQLTELREKLGSLVKATTSYSYDPNGNPLTRNNTKQNAIYTYDVRDLLDTTT
jgi:YD repeat-containing protein